MQVGLDFGTTNSALCVAFPDGRVRLATFAAGPGPPVTTFRSILYCDPERRNEDRTPVILAGPQAIASSLRAERRGRLILSPKSFLASRLFTSTLIEGVSFALEDLIGILLATIRREAEAQFGEVGRRIVAGRPVVFSGAENTNDDAFALERLASALRFAGWDDVVFEYEPAGAAYAYARRVEAEQLVLIADLGGGTSDFSLVRIVPAKASGGTISSEILGTSGVAIGGDTFDGRIVRHLVSPALGRGSAYRGFNLERIPIPVWIYGSLERWHHLSLLNTADTLHMLRKIAEQAFEREKIEALIAVIEHNMGFGLYRAIERTKHELSAQDASLFRFEEPPVSMNVPVARAELEAWTREDVAGLARCMEDLLDRCGVSARRVDRVFLTGGSSLVPAIRRIFQQAFGAGKMQGGGELTSVAEGLALRAKALFG